MWPVSLTQQFLQLKKDRIAVVLVLDLDNTAILFEAHRNPEQMKHIKDNRYRHCVSLQLLQSNYYINKIFRHG
jgi:hypothetical protein